LLPLPWKMWMLKAKKRKYAVSYGSISIELDVFLFLTVAYDHLSAIQIERDQTRLEVAADGIWAVRSSKRIR